MKPVRAAFAAVLLSCSTVAAGPLDGEGFIGIQLQQSEVGVGVDQVLEGHPAANAGLQAGDVVLTLDGETLTSVEHLVGLTRAKKPGTTVKIGLLRQGGALEVVLMLGVRPDRAAMVRDQLLGQPAPALPVRLEGGTEQASLADYRGRAVVVDFWATWCGPCRATLPRLNALRARYPENQLAMLAVTDESPAKVRPHQGRIDYTIAFDEKREANTNFLVYALPTFVVLDRDGKVTAVLTGAGDHTMRELEKAVAAVVP